ncbi:hypothetical protein HPB50_026468 [Hyalomma asiaticum]|uniref:Uncharacterized protein n=1 Tax=Hyalomma asiaticum TaxID=266040 RepID=A0ACB7T1T4_HYAAI|nr:hypothetical protein HPB50_026468 [Hyalomma asiaticum]
MERRFVRTGGELSAMRREIMVFLGVVEVVEVVEVCLVNDTSQAPDVSLAGGLSLAVDPSQVVCTSRTVIVSHEDVIPRNTPQCTDYVYIRFFVYSYIVNQMSLKFEHKKQWDGTTRLYYDETPAVWRKLGSYSALDDFVKKSKSNFPLSRWFLGMWGSALTRLMASRWDASNFRDSLERTLRMNFSDKAFRWTTYRPILEPHWVLIHTVAIWPGGNASVPESMVANVLRDADVVGISTSNTTDESNIILARAGFQAVPYKAASPPNPLRAVAPGTRGMLDILKEFPHWKNVLKRNKLCFSVTTSINYMHNSADPIDFVSEIHKADDVQRYGRERFLTKGRSNKYPVEDKQTTYYFDNKTYSHFWRSVRNRSLLTLFAYDTGDTLSYKVTEMLKAYGQDKCVVLDDLADDNVDGKFTYNGKTVQFGKFEILSAVQSVMTKLYGAPFP